ncbi:MAG: hypothetical protein ACI9K8_000159, partial [Reinekea sp.]
SVHNRNALTLCFTGAALKSSVYHGNVQGSNAVWLLSLPAFSHYTKPL